MTHTRATRQSKPTKRKLEDTTGLLSVDEEVKGHKSKQSRNTNQRKPKRKAAATKAETDDEDSSGDVDMSAGSVECVIMILSRYCVDSMIQSWSASNNALEWSMINFICETTSVWNGLFPKPGENMSTKQGGGTPKAAHHLKICEHLFSMHEEYQDVFNSCTTSKLRGPWILKIKNKLKECVVILLLSQSGN